MMNWQPPYMLQSFPPIVMIAILVWNMFWKGIALYRSASESQRNWFIALLVINTMGILEIIYLFKFAKKPLSIKEMKSWINK